MRFGERNLSRGSFGDDVVELQLRLAGFLGTIWDGDFGRLTKLQVEAFQRDYMKVNNPDGVVGQNTFDALDRFAAEFPISFEKPLSCSTCPDGGGGNCTGNGSGQNRFKGIYRRQANLKLERHHQYEFPGIHKAILHTYRAFSFYAREAGLPGPQITSGYRCHINNIIKGRNSTNHMGKAMDFSFPAGISRNELRRICNQARDILQEKANFQVRWENDNQKALEPGIQEIPGEFTAPTWVHMDVRQYGLDNFLQSKYFVKSAAELDDKNLD